MYMPQVLHMEFEVILQFLRKLPGMRGEEIANLI